MLQVVGDEYFAILSEAVELGEDIVDIALPYPLVKVDAGEIVVAETSGDLSDSVVDGVGAGSFDGQV